MRHYGYLSAAMLSMGFLLGAIAPGVSVQKTLDVPANVKPAKAADKVPAGVTAHENVVYSKVGDRELKLDLYVPAGEGPFPGVAIIHGGGWQGGSKESCRGMAQSLAAKGFATATVEYRLSGEAPYPAAMHDCKASVRWMRANASTYHIDPNRIGGIGGSAGGHLVAMVGLTSDQPKLEGTGGNPEHSSKLQALVLMGAGVDQVGRTEEATNPIGNQVQFFGGTIEQKRDVYVEASPITHVSKHTPPILFIEGELDKPGQRYVEMRKKLDALSVENRLVVVKGGKHGCWNSEPWATPMTEEIAVFLKAKLAAK